MTQHQEFAIKQREKDLKGLAKAKEQESKSVKVKMKLKGMKGFCLVDEKRVEERLNQGFEKI